MNKYKLGLYKSPRDIRDYAIASFLKAGKLPTDIDFTDIMTPVRNQGNEGSCVGFATVVGVKEYQEITGKDASPGIGLSPRFVYENAKKISGHSEGTTLKAAMEVVSRLGVCLEKDWPYVAQSAGKPTIEAYSNALKYRVSTYARITSLDELKRAICDPKIGPSMIGVTVYKGMVSDECKRTGIVPNPSCFDKMNALGGHALCAVGYNDKSPYFNNDGHVKCKNSWGKDFGDKGYIYLSYKYINSNMVDAFSSVDIDELPYKIITVANISGRNAWV